MSSITISGIVSGLDTTGIIDKLVAVEGNSKTLLTNQQTAQKSVVSAYSSLLSSIGSLTDQVSKLGNTSKWATTSATSSSSSVTTTATGNTAGTLTFDVTKIAAAHTLVSAGTVNSTGASVASSGTLTLTKSTGATTHIDVGNGSLAEVVAAINGAGAGISATAVQTSPGQYRLQVASSSSGAASQFTLSGIDGFSAMNTLKVGGTAPNAYTVTSATNTFSNVAQGINFTVSKAETGVTVSSSVDPKNVSDQISSLVTNVNNLLTSISQNTAYDATTKTGGPLLGNGSVRTLQQGVLNIVAGISAPGLSVTSAGQLSFDATAFATAFRSDPAGVASAFGASSSFDADSSAAGATVRMTNSTGGTEAGSYNVKVTANAKQEQWQLVQPGTGVVGRLLTLTRGSNSVSYTVANGEDATTAAANFNAKLAQAGFGASVAADVSGGIKVTATNAGSAAAFTAKLDGVAAQQLTAGSDIRGTIDGTAATGIGNILSLPPTAGSGARGLSVAVTASDAEITASGGAIGSLDYKPGVARQLESLFTQMSDSSTGELVTAQAQASAQVRTLQTQIDNWTTRLADYKSALTQKFTAMESSLSALKAQSTALSQFFNTSSSSSSSKS